MFLMESMGFVWWIMAVSGVIGVASAGTTAGLLYYKIWRDRPKIDRSDELLTGIFSILAGGFGLILWPALLPVAMLALIGFGIGFVPERVDHILRKRQSKTRIKMVERRKSADPTEWKIEHELQVRPHHNCDPTRPCALGDEWLT